MLRPLNQADQRVEQALKSDVTSWTVADGSRRRVIAKAKIISAFIATEEEVNVVQILLIVILLGGGGGMNPDISMPSLETFTGRASF